MTQTTLIAVVEDDPEIRPLIAGLLQREGFEVVACAGGKDLDRAMAHRRVDLVILDLMMPGEDGLSICRRLRSGPLAMPIIMVTAKGDAVDRVIGIELGADDYLAKPFDPRELVARTRAVLRRTRDTYLPPQPAARLYAFAGWTLNAGSRRLTNTQGQPVELTGAEFDLLMVFLTHPQRVLNRDQLLDWTRRRSAMPFDRAIDVQLSRLRRKLDNAESEMIKTVRGGGYLFAPAVENL
ncbi:two-component system OmpR family response regulator [Duganella sp. 1411]|jgi:two-component system OmpR family response regulator|uniref:response regulator n=1 Tax=Duganella sp. 1411 TaxID=2806572 RepID=UPI001AE20345|nr:response regulator [Duganella sp. 1411]MBP1202162.1 two-component system OmpR family response regulator [Duganella sp. 1411]